MLLGKRVSWAELVQEALQKPVKSVTHKSIARLWSGYGSIQEVAATTDDGQQHRLVVKQVLLRSHTCSSRPALGICIADPTTCVLPTLQVDPPQERGVSHERKLKSYAAEAAFYSHYCSRVLASGSAAAVAQPLLVDVRPPTHFLFVLSDLRVQFPERRYTLDAQVRTRGRKPCPRPLLGWHISADIDNVQCQSCITYTARAHAQSPARDLG
jgi:hypothetical protein